jgi:hypothetical protein
MRADLDGYEAYYAQKLWLLLPAAYRGADSDDDAVAGPLREIVDRIGAQAAIVRRSIDRFWEDQSIETCDDWVIAYAGDLLATHLVAALDARGHRIDVAKTIYYRRRKGTLGILEEIAADVTGWDARVVEFFRRLGRTRHGLDPEIGLPAQAAPPADPLALQHAEGIIGPLSATPLGGFADLRNAYGASRAKTAFDEFSYTADFRRGRGLVGWHDIPRLGVFLWRLESFAVPMSTPVGVNNCAGYFAFDPTGREIELFAAPSRKTEQRYGDLWVSPQEWQLPAPIDQRLYDADAALLYPQSFGVYHRPGSDYELVPQGGVVAWPALGRFHDVIGAAGPTYAAYHYGFSSTIGAGPYDRRIGAAAPADTPPVATSAKGGGSLTVAVPVATTEIADSLTYTAVADVTNIDDVAVRGANGERPVIRLTAGPPQTWAFTGNGPAAQLTVEGLLVSGVDVVLRGMFETVTFRCATLDPGESGLADHPATAFRSAVDGRPLVPATLWIEGEIGTLVLDRCITGPIRTRNAGILERLIANDSIVEDITEPGTAAISSSTVELELSRCTILGRVFGHRLYASDSILADIVQIDDIQHGCVRFSAWPSTSVIPDQYESVETPANAPLFVSRRFGDGAFAQLSESADNAILTPPSAPGAPPPTILEGAADGSEMGAFARELAPLKDRGILQKYAEYMPAGLIPVLVHVT